GLDRVEDQEVRALAFGNRRQNVLDISFGREFDRRLVGAEPLRAQTDLRYRLLTGDVDDAMTAQCERSRGLRQQGRLANTWIAADQQRRTAHEAASRRAVQLADTGDDARRFLDLAGEGGQRHRPALARTAQA